MLSIHLYPLSRPGRVDHFVRKIEVSLFGLDTFRLRTAFRMSIERIQVNFRYSHDAGTTLGTLATVIFGWCWFGCLALRCGPSVTAPATTSLVRLNELRCNPRDEPQPAKGRYRYRHQINDIREPRPARRSIWSVTGLKYSHDLFRSASTNMFPTVVAEYRFGPTEKYRVNKAAERNMIA